MLITEETDGPGECGLGFSAGSSQTSIIAYQTSYILALQWLYSEAYNAISTMGDIATLKQSYGRVGRSPMSRLIPASIVSSCIHIERSPLTVVGYAQIHLATCP